MNKRKKTKKGFTLIEVIMAVTIFSFGIAAAAVAITNASYMETNANVDLQMVAYNQSLAEYIKEAGKTQIKLMNDKLATIETTSTYYTYYIYYDNQSELESEALDSTSPKATGTVPSVLPSYDSCKGYAASYFINKKFGAYVKIEKDASIYTTSGYEYYKVTTASWNLKSDKGVRTEARADFEVGR